MNKKGFAIVEVLVAFIILTTVLSLLTYSQKNFNSNITRLQNFEDIYTTVLSLKNKVDIEMALGEKKHFDGKLNNLNYSIDINKLYEGNNLSYDSMESTYTKGIHIYTLYKVTIKIREIGKTYTFYKLRTYFDKNLIEKQFEGI